MKNFKRLSGGILPFAIALALSLAAFISEAKAASISLGSLSSASGSVVLNNGVGNNLFITTDTYAFTLTGTANVSGNFAFFSSTADYVMGIDLGSIAGNLVQTTAIADHI